MQIISVNIKVRTDGVTCLKIRPSGASKMTGQTITAVTFGPRAASATRNRDRALGIGSYHIPILVNMIEIM